MSCNVCRSKTQRQQVHVYLYEPIDYRRLDETHRLVSAKFQQFLKLHALDRPLVSHYPTQLQLKQHQAYSRELGKYQSLLHRHSVKEK